jgi:hypothetical protein
MCRIAKGCAKPRFILPYTSRLNSCDALVGFARNIAFHRKPIASGLRQRGSVANEYFNHLWRPHEPDRRNGSAKARRDNQVTASFDNMAIHGTWSVVAAKEILADYGQIYLAAVGVAAKRQRDAIRNAAENEGLMREQENGCRILHLRDSPGEIVTTSIASRA